MSEGPRIYVACLAAYNDGHLHGKWIDADQTAEELAEEVTAMLAKSPVPLAEEYAIHDYDGFQGWKLEEYTSLAAVSAVAGLIASHGDAFAKWIDYTGMDPAEHEAEELEEQFQEQYRGHYSSEEDFAQTYPQEFGEDWVVTAIGSGELPEWAQAYMDWERIARDLFIDGFWSAIAADGGERMEPDYSPGDRVRWLGMGQANEGEVQRLVVVKTDAGRYELLDPDALELVEGER
jgi:antirestriction protein